MLRWLALVFIVVQDVGSAFFDPTDIEDPLALLWNTKVQEHDQCRARDTDGTVRTGVCKHRTHCYLSGGKSLGHCGILSTCCVLDTSCSKRTSAKVSHFESNQDTSKLSRCTYTIDLENPRICQIRFRLARPSFLEGRGYRCDVDSFSVTPHTYNVPTLCGYNDNQHVYVHLDSTQKQVTLQVNLADRKLTSDVFDNPIWQIEVTQLECSSLDKYIFKKYHNVLNDFELLAPRGAIQYFTEPSGIIRSFNYNPNTKTNSYTSPLSYGIAFKQFPNLCGIKFTTTYINIRDVAQTIDYNDECWDHLFIPELIFLSPFPISGPPIANICITQTTEPVEFYSGLPGPFNIHFVSATPQPIEEPNVGPWAFDMRYNFDVCTI